MRVISDDTLLEVEQTMFGTKIRSHLIKPIRKIVSIVLEAGLIDFEASKFNRQMKKFEHKYKDEGNSNGNSNNPSLLSLKHVYPIFVFWGMGLICATAVFIMEHYTTLSTNVQRNTNRNNETGVFEYHLLNAGFCSGVSLKVRSIRIIDELEFDLAHFEILAGTNLIGHKDVTTSKNFLLPMYDE
ncbi:hypothetical protein FQA39_LY02065 [Lamprigera yunnana]|nr:hypothetical protein FQA39_LY02065 [Lamprigera yunnana]